ncbi:hypothetical protein J4Q44_G00350600 [Coregonus suidteri]|uniref:Macrophage-expressed gene 1 protein n=1 Tax=Coregonus suidteri TaxID=861788 RepID=A0AAN8Q7P4_9TELE
MALRAYMLVLSLLHQCVSHPLSPPDNGLRKCRTNLSALALEVLPGGEWDNLRNMDMGRVMNFSYSQCQTTEDGVYLIPDEVFVIPQKLTVLNAKFSTENQRVKSHQVQDSSVTTRVQVRNFLYTVKAHPDFTLDGRFVRQAEEIADAIENNQTRQAAYLSEKMVLDYGTHVITSIDAGASLVQEDYLSDKYVSTTDKFSVKALAGLNFFHKLKFDIGSEHAQETSDSLSYQGNITYSIIQSHGGAPFYPGITLQKWQESTKNNLVGIDRAGLPLHYFLNRLTLPDLPEPTVGKLSLFVSEAIHRYYTINTRPGCVNPDSPNFNFQANVEDNSCEGPATNLTFGGVFQQCTKLTDDADPICQNLAQMNPDTGSYSCREPYTPTLLRGEPIPTEPSDQNQELSPVNYFQINFLSNGLIICLSKDYETASKFSVPFGGFFSCQSNNPLAGGQPRCPPKFSQHLAGIIDGCQVLYCVQSGLFTGGQLLPVHLPPFTRRPLVSIHANKTMVVMTDGDQVWVRVGETNRWNLTKLTDVRMLNPASAQMSDGKKFGVHFGVDFGVICLVALVTVGAVLLVRRRRGAGFGGGKRV